MQQNDQRHIAVQQQFSREDVKKDTNKTQFDKIYQIKIDDLSLRELLLMQSIFQVDRPIDISALILEQPRPTTFFKVFLELELRCVVSYFAFDSRSIIALLDESNKSYFSSD